jgi:hypothetical protein
MGIRKGTYLQPWLTEFSGLVSLIHHLFNYALPTMQTKVTRNIRGFIV